MFLFFLEGGEKHLKGVSSAHISSLPGNPGGCVLTGHAPSLWSCHLWVWPQAPSALKTALNLLFHWCVCVWVKLTVTAPSCYSWGLPRPGLKGPTCCYTQRQSPLSENPSSEETNSRSQENWAPHVGRLTLDLEISSICFQPALMLPNLSLACGPNQCHRLCSATVTDEKRS